MASKVVLPNPQNKYVPRIRFSAIKIRITTTSSELVALAKAQIIRLIIVTANVIPRSRNFTLLDIGDTNSCCICKIKSSPNANSTIPIPAGGTYAIILFTVTWCRSVSVQVKIETGKLDSQSQKHTPHSALKQSFC